MSTVVDGGCWFCDGRIREHDGVIVASLGGAVVHKRCLVDLGGRPAAPDPADEDAGSDPSG